MRELEELQIKATKLATKGQYAIAVEVEAARHQGLLALYGEEHLDTIRALENLSFFRFRAKQHEPAFRSLDRVIEMRTRIQGSTHEDTLAATASMVAYLYKSGNLDQAERLGTIVALTCKVRLGIDNYATQRAISNLAGIYLAKEYYPNAQKLFAEVLQARQKTLPQDHPELMRTMVNLAGVYVHQQRWSLAREPLETVLSVRRKSLGDEHDLTFNVAEMLLQVYMELGQWNEAEIVQLLVFHTTKDKLGAEHPSTVNAMMDLIRIYLNIDKWKEFMTLLEDVIQIKKKESPVDDTIVQQLQYYHDSVRKKNPEGVPLPVSGNFIYQPLESAENQIRLVSVKKGSTADPLKASLMQATHQRASGLRCSLVRMGG